MNTGGPWEAQLTFRNSNTNFVPLKRAEMKGGGSDPACHTVAMYWLTPIWPGNYD